MLFSVSQRPSVPYQFLENRTKQSCTQFSGLRSWGRTNTWIPFSNLLLFCKTIWLCSYFQDMDCLLALWRLLFPSLLLLWPYDDCYSLTYCCYVSGFGVFAQIYFLPKASLYNNIKAHAAMNKAPLFHSRLWVPHILLFVDCRTQVPVCKDCNTIRDPKTSN